MNDNMTMNVQKRLFEPADPAYADFQARLTPTVDREHFIGVRVPNVRKLAKEIYRAGDYAAFLNDLPHRYYDENMLHGLLIAEIKDYAACVAEIEKFLPFVDNWAVCDTMHPKCFKKHRAALLPFIQKWIASDKEFTVRFGLEMIMNEFLDEDFDAQYLQMAANVRSDAYYVNMMIAWLFATALCKQWDAALPFLTSHAMDVWTHNKTIQKARESHLITPAQKEYLATLKREE